MFQRVLVANRGEIAVRIVRACRDMGVWAIALYDRSDQGSLHVRLADEAVELTSGLGYLDGDQILQLALDVGADAIHPGYGFLAEQPAFIRACEQAGITFIGPPAEVATLLRNKIAVLERARQAGIPIPVHSSTSFGEDDYDRLRLEAERLGYPLIIKPCSGGRGRGARLVRNPAGLEQAVRDAHSETHSVFGDGQLFLEKAILPAYYLDVPIVGDRYGTLLHLGERNGSVQRNSQKLIVESPASCLAPAQREEVRRLALKIARLFNYQNIGAVEFLRDGAGNLYFTEIKARIQVEHPVTEMISHVDLVREQIEIAVGKRLSLRQEDVRLQGWAMSCRINAEDPWNHFLPSPGHLRRFRLPGGPNVRVDTYAYSGCDVPVRYDPILAKVCVWGEDRDECLRRMARTLQDFAISGISTNLPLHQRILEHPDFIRGDYTTDFLRHLSLEPGGPVEDLRDLAVAAAIAYVARHQAFRPVSPPRLQHGWRRSASQLDWE